MRSDNVRCGMQQAPHRSLLNALGLTPEEMERAGELALRVHRALGLAG